MSRQQFTGSDYCRLNVVTTKERKQLLTRKSRMLGHTITWYVNRLIEQDLKRPLPRIPMYLDSNGWEEAENVGV